MGEISDDHQSYIADEMADFEAKGELGDYWADFNHSQRVERERQAQAARDAAWERKARQRNLDLEPPF